MPCTYIFVGSTVSFTNGEQSVVLKERRKIIRTYNLSNLMYRIFFAEVALSLVKREIAKAAILSFNFFLFSENVVKRGSI